MKEGTPSFEDHIIQVKSALQKMLEQRQKQSMVSDDWLIALFEHYSSQMRADNERIWTTGSLFLPLSFAPFVVFAGIAAPKLWHVLICGSPSIALIYAWMVIADNHRAFQQKSEAWLIAIQQVQELDPPRFVKLPIKGWERFFTGPGEVQKMRYRIFVFTMVAWFILFLAVVYELVA